MRGDDQEIRFAFTRLRHHVRICPGLFRLLRQSIEGERRYYF
jgi:hypothetical protein